MRGALLATQKGETQGEEPLITLLDTALREKIFLLRIAIWFENCSCELCRNVEFSLCQSIPIS